MQDRRIVIYESIRRGDAEGAKYWGLLWLALIALLLGSWGLSWVWREAAAVICHPFVSPLYTVVVLTIFAFAHALLIWSVFRILSGLFRIGRAMFFALADRITALLHSVRNRLF